MLSRSTLRADRMRAALADGHLTATDLADALVERGTPFREAHHIVGNAVGWCAERGRALESLTAEELATLTGHEDPTLLGSLDPARSVARRDVLGGPAPARVEAALRSAEQRLAERRAEIDALRTRVDLSHLL
jgi:argininosuccinate lyase